MPTPKYDENKMNYNLQHHCPYMQGQMTSPPCMQYMHHQPMVVWVPMVVGPQGPNSRFNEECFYNCMVNNGDKAYCYEYCNY